MAYSSQQLSTLEAYQSLATDIVADAIKTVRGDVSLRYSFDSTPFDIVRRISAGLEDLEWLFSEDGGIRFLRAMDIEEPFEFIIRAILVDERPFRREPPPRRQPNQFNPYYELDYNDIK